MATNIGMMDSAYFVGRSEILAWINSTLQLNLSKVEEVLVFFFNFILIISSNSIVLNVDLLGSMNDRLVLERFIVS